MASETPEREYRGEAAPGSGGEAAPGSGGEAAGLYVVSDREGFVGAFTSRDAAQALVYKQYPLTPFITQRFRREAGDASRVWVVLYRANDAVAFVSNSRDVAFSVQTALGAVGLIHEGDNDHWEHPTDLVAAGAKTRLGALRQAYRMYATPALEAEEAARGAAHLEAMERALFGHAAPGGAPPGGSILECVEVAAAEGVPAIMGLAGFAGENGGEPVRPDR